MHLAQQALLEFHKKMKQTIGDPRKPNVQQEQEFRMDLVEEELKELYLALEADDVVKTADGLADLIYVLVGSAVTWGIDLASVFDEVHRSNMTKKPDNKRADGKVLKDADFSPARIGPVLEDAANNLDCGEDGWWEEPTVAHLELEEPPQQVSDRIMVAAKDQARMLAMKSIKADLVPALKDLRAVSDGVPKAIKGEFTAYGAYIFDCACERRHAVQAKLGSRGGMASSGSCECMCGRAYLVDFTTKEPTVAETTIEEMRKANV